MAQQRERQAPLIAIIGSDGSGKSTVSEHVLDWARKFGPAEAFHLGKQSGNIGRALSQLPLVGSLLDRKITKESVRKDKLRGEKSPKFSTVLVIYVFLLRRVYRFKRMLATWHTGVIIVADRYPQLDLPDAYDGTGLSVTATGNPIVRWLARRERQRFEWMTSFRPDLVIRLNVDLDTACARKPDHKREALARKIAATPQFTFNGAPIAEIDSSRPLAEVLEAAKAAVTRTLVEHGYTAPTA